MDIVNLALRRNLFFPSAEIYGGAAGLWDYGPIGLKIVDNVRTFWRKYAVENNNYTEISGSCILPKIVFEASGHLSSLNDPIIKCTKCGSVERADKLVAKLAGTELGESADTKEFDKIIANKKIVCEKCKGKFGKAEKFNLMFPLSLGATGKELGYLRGEACQNIFLAFSRMYKTKNCLPLGIAQAGRAFRNEIAPRNALIRVREMEQMDVEIFFNPKKDDYKVDEKRKLPILFKNGTFKEVTIKELKDKKLILHNVISAHLLQEYDMLLAMGFKKDKIRFREVDENDRAFYSAFTFDTEVETSLGWVEITANNYRTDHDLSRHGKFSKQNLSVKEEGEEKEFTPHIYETSKGLGRTVYCLIDQNLTEINGKVVLTLNPGISPYDCAVYPLVNKDGIDGVAEELNKDLKSCGFNVLYEDKGSVGKRYAKSDEIGVRYAITVDYDSLKDKAVTLRDSWTTKQDRIKIKDLKDKLFELKYKQ
ncbi:MAG: glycine--tRNA ligase [Candidatus ainarchaeum sp.]|nr:glycine--tRNA ligase [Candidatus ainarchaeum sp.]